MKNANEIFIGSDCEEHLNNLIIKGYIEVVKIVRQNCLKFYLTAADEIRKRLPISNYFLQNLQVFLPAVSLCNDNRQTSFQNVAFIAKTLCDFDEEALKKEWLNLPADFTEQEKQNLYELNFDEMWKEILQRQSNNNYRYPILRNILSAVRSLLNSNADPERPFSILTELKSKKRNKLSSTCVNAICVIKSVLKTRGKQLSKWQ